MDYAFVDFEVLTIMLNHVLNNECSSWKWRLWVSWFDISQLSSFVSSCMAWTSLNSAVLVKQTQLSVNATYSLAEGMLFKLCDLQTLSILIKNHNSLTLETKLFWLFIQVNILVDISQLFYVWNYISFMYQIYKHIYYYITSDLGMEHQRVIGMDGRVTMPWPCHSISPVCR